MFPIHLKLRSQILLALLLFALLPIVVTVATNLPPVLSLLGSFHQKVYLQEFRSDFRDLDQHLASRQEMLKLIAKLSEPGLMLGPSVEENLATIDAARASYTEWVNRILSDQLDVIEIQFFDSSGKVRFWLERDITSREWATTLKKPTPLSKNLLEQTLLATRTSVQVSRVQIDPAAINQDPRRIMNLHLMSPLKFKDDKGASGAVMMVVDIGGMAQRYAETFWVYDDGRYLEVSRQGASGLNAFDEFPGLSENFLEGKIFLWKGDDGRQVIWVPLIETESTGPLWVGRIVDTSSLVDFSSQLIIRVSGIVLVLMIIAWTAARWLASRAETIGHDVTDSLTRLLEDDETVNFNWSWTDELQLLGEKLSHLSSQHVKNNKRLLNHTRELEESNRYKSEFLTNVSHELRTPLNSILLLSKMLADKESNLDDAHVKQAQVIHQAGKDLQALIENILDLSKIEARSTSLNLENIYLPDLLNEVHQLMEPQFTQKNLFLKINIEDDAPISINTDADKLKQILKNFLSNAIKFTEVGGVTISLSHRIGAENADAFPICISIKDTGIGIPNDKQELIFQAFKQVDGSTSRRFGGTGLGLSISRELAHLLGGEIELKSVENEGSDFRLRLPLAFDRETIKNEQIGIDEPLNVSGFDLQENVDEDIDFTGRQALIVDADIRDLLSLTTMLESCGFQVMGADDQEETLEAVTEENFAVVLMDTMMPGLNGYDTMKKIHQQPDCSELPIVAFTSGLDEAEYDACISSGASDCLVKPVNEKELKKVLMKLLIKESSV